MTVTPDDYGFDPVAGTLVASSAEEIAIRRSDPAVGAVVVHFPRFGFRVGARVSGYRTLRAVPRRETRREEVMVEGQHEAAAQSMHHGEAHGVGIGDALVAELREPRPRGLVMLAVRVDDPDQRRRVDAVEGRSCRGDAGLEEEPAVHLCQDEVGGDEDPPPHDRRTKRRVRLAVAGIARAVVRNPGAAIDEHASLVSAASDTLGVAPRHRFG